MEKYYGVYNTYKKEFQFGICESSKKKATDALFKKIGKDAYKWRFEIKELKFGNPKAEPILRKHLKIDDYVKPVHNTIIVPENATNGDMIKALFGKK